MVGPTLGKWTSVNRATLEDFKTTFCMPFGVFEVFDLAPQKAPIRFAFLRFGP